MRSPHVDDCLDLYIGDASARADISRGVFLCHEVGVLFFDPYAVSAEIGVFFVYIRPLRGNELDLVVGLDRLEQAGHTHRPEVSLIVTHSLAVFAVSLASDSPECADHGSQHRVARAVGEVFRVDRVPCVGRELPSDDARDRSGTVGVGVADRAVHDDLDILFGGHLAPHNAVPERELKSRVAVDVLLLKLGDDARLAVAFSLRSADPHADLARAVAAEHRTVLDEDDLYALTRRRDSRAHTREPSADDAEVAMMVKVTHRICFYCKHFM